MPDEAAARSFTYRSARSSSLVAGFTLAIAVETVVLHLLTVARHPWLAWAMTASSAGALVWLWRDYRGMGAGAVTRHADGALDLTVGWRFAIPVAAGAIERVERPTWKALPVAGTPAARDFLNLTKPAAANVLITLATPATVRLPGGLRRPVRRVALHLDEPDAFVAAYGGTAGV